jgi:hypothetical protein
MVPVRSLAAICVLAFLQGASSKDSVPLTWDKPDHFWYRKSVTGGNQWLQVDALHGVREPHFDHRRLAVELNLKSGFAFTALTLPFADPAAEFVVVHDGSNAPIEGAMAIEFLLDGHHWRCDLQAEWDWGKEPPTDYECQKGEARGPRLLPGGDVVLPIFLPPIFSPDGKWEAFVQNHNVVIRPAGSATDAKPLSTDGSAAQPYDRWSLRWSRDSKTLSAYRVSPEVWRSESLTGSVKDLVSRHEFRAPQ